MKTVRNIAGCMTGTSIDGLDAALVSIEGSGLDMRVEVLNSLSRPLGDLAKPLRRLSLQESMTAGQIAEVSKKFALFHLDLLKELIGRNKVDLISVHGQTVFHQPPLSWQLINPSVIAYGLSVPVVYDLRAADLALGGEGAPITPGPDYILFRSESESRAIVNLGGFCNITIIPACGNENIDQADNLKLIKGLDVCSCNQLLDRIAGWLFKIPFDEDGKIAADGEVDEALYIALLNLLQEQADGKQSLGTGDELQHWLAKAAGGEGGLSIKPLNPGEGGLSSPPQNSRNNIARTACAAIAETIVRSCQDADRLILAGGGVYNKTLANEIRERLAIPVDICDRYGIGPSYREAVAMAVLGALCQDRVAITLPQVTGVSVAPVAGCWVLP